MDPNICPILGYNINIIGNNKIELEIAQSEQDVSPFCKESDMTYRPIVESVRLGYFCDSKMSCR